MLVRFQILVTLPTKVYFCGLSCKSRPRAAPVRGTPQGRPSAYARSGDFAVTGRDRSLSRNAAFTTAIARQVPTHLVHGSQAKAHGPLGTDPPIGPRAICISLSASDPRKRHRGGFQTLGEQRPKAWNPTGRDSTTGAASPAARPKRPTVSKRTLGRGSI